MFLNLIRSTLIVFFIVLPACSLLDNDIDKAKKFMAAGMYPQAIELLNKTISEKPDNAEAHFQLGICYINTDNFRGADERFGSAVQLKSDYGYQIGGEYKKAGSSALDKGQISQARDLFKKAVEYQPSLKSEIVEYCFQKGEPAFDVILSIAPDQKTRLADYYKSLNDKTSDEEKKIAYLKKAANLDSNKYGEEYNTKAQTLGRKYLDLAKEAARWVAQDADAEKYRKLASEYLGEGVVERKLPLKKVYNEGNDFVFELNEGEKIPHKIIAENGTPIKCRFFFTPESDFRIILDNGNTYNIQKGDKIPEGYDGGLGIVALKKSKVILRVIQNEDSVNR